ncbi:MAG: Murein DD-endopeptidase MepH [Candidatus Erwinia impunctatus]|nr:Murein DD-endopeptidase MepH [Culicoides impunctatus]
MLNMIRFLCTFLLLASLQFTSGMAHASPQAATVASQQKSDAKSVKDNDRRKRRQHKTTTPEKTVSGGKQRVTAALDVKKKKPQSVTSRSVTHTTTSVKKHRVISKRAQNSEIKHSKQSVKVALNKKPVLSKFHRARYQTARETAVNKLMKQLGKPYQWGGASPKTGFDCSGLVWYAYKDLLKFKIPRTANEMYHLRDAPPVKRNELEKGDLVFFQINGRGTADHVGVYLGGGKFIQSPSSGKDIQVTALADEYWQNHYIGARRFMTPTSIR